MLVGLRAVELVKCPIVLTDLPSSAASQFETDSPKTHLNHQSGLLNYTVEHPDSQLTVETEQASSSGMALASLWSVTLRKQMRRL